MFDQSFIDQFYNPDFVMNPDKVDENFKKAYYEFIETFCKATAPFWKSYVDNKLCERVGGVYSPHLTTSDEALTLWLIQQEFEKAKEDSNLIARMGPETWNKTREKRKRGQHMCVSKQSDYVTLYNKVKSARSDPEALEFWQNLYFDTMFELRGKSVLDAMSRKLAMQQRMSGEEDEAHRLPYDEGLN